MKALKDMADKALAVCAQHNWQRGWSAGGCYLFLESAEFIEALRGKGESPPEEEAADVLFVLLSLCKANKVNLDEVHRLFQVKCDALLGDKVV